MDEVLEAAKSGIPCDRSSPAELNRLCEQFLYLEAECLDEQRFSDWLQLLDPAIRYRIPVRTLRENWDGPDVSDKAFYMNETMATLRARLSRLASRFAWSENPATRTRRLVANVRADRLEEDLVSVRSNIAIYCYHREASQPLLLTADRHDKVRVTNGRLVLLSRRAVLDGAVLGLEALSIFV